MASNKQRITIDSILGGISNFVSPASDAEYGDALSINPYMFLYADNPSRLFVKPTGIIAPTVTETIATTITGSPYWMVPNPKNITTYVYSSSGSVYSVDSGLSAITALGDLNDGGTASGNGCAYYDNYMYFARDTTVARYGPLNGTPAFTDDYWVSTLGKTALSNSTYSEISESSFEVPNHILHRHTNGALYIADVLDNQGVIHYIKTSKTTVEGDTDNGSKYDALDLPYGYFPTSMESYGDFLVIAVAEMSSSVTFNSPLRARIIFWDTTSETYNQIIDHEVSDALISKILNVNGTLYFFAGTPNSNGLKVYRYIGGNSVEEVILIGEAHPPLPGAVFHDTKAFYFACNTYNFSLEARPRIYMYDLNLSALHSIGAQANQSGLQTSITSIAKQKSSGSDVTSFVYSGWTNGTISGISRQDNNTNLDSPGSSVSTVNAEWISRSFSIGMPFKILKVRVPLLFPNGLDASTDITPSFLIDSDTTPVDLTSINITNFSSKSGKRSFSIKPNNPITGEHSFRFRLKWNNGSVTPVDLPILIEYELLTDEA